MKQYFNFNGVAKRQEYWAVVIISILAMVIGFVALEDPSTIAVVFGLVTLVATIWAILATTVRRLRDAGLNVWWILVTLIPYVGTVATIVFGCIGSVESKDDNA